MTVCRSEIDDEQSFIISSRQILSSSAKPPDLLFGSLSAPPPVDRCALHFASLYDLRCVRRCLVNVNIIIIADCCNYQYFQVGVIYGQEKHIMASSSAKSMSRTTFFTQLFTLTVYQINCFCYCYISSLHL